MKKFSFLALCLLASAGLFAQTQVTADKTGVDLQAAIDAAKAGDTVYVQAGTFYGNFKMKDGVNVSGGWDAEFKAQTDYATILDAQANGRVLEQPNVYFENLTVWNNLTFQNGKLMANGKGAGVLLYGNSRLTNCLIQNNTFNEGVTNCEGGGLAQDFDNHAADVIADKCIIKNNEATHGGGVYLRSTMTNCVIENNRTLLTHPGGGAHLQWGRLYNCIIRNNHSSEDAGGVRAYGNCKLIGCLIADNKCSGKVAGVALERTLGEMINCTVVNNDQDKTNTDKEYCGIRFDSDNADGNKFINNVIWGNKAGGEVQGQQVSYSICKYADATNNAIQGNVPGDFKTPYIKLAENPGFANPANGDYSILFGSPLVNAGLASAMTMEQDLAGNDRVINGAIDLGAYELPAITVAAGADLQAAIDAAKAGYTVYVQAGTYNGNFTMKEGVNVSGGWNADFTAQTDYASILDAQANGRVLNQPAAFTTLTIWSNFTIQNGDLKEKAADQLGSGVALNKKGQVKHCLIQNNTFSYTSGNCMGGGVCNDATDKNTDVQVDNCIVRNNKATHGGGIRVRGTVINSIIENNLTEANACGGVHLQGGRLLYSIVRGNTGKDTGGVRAYGKCEVINNLICGNTGTNTLGGLSMENNLSTVIGNTIVGNNQKSDSNPSRCGVRINVNSDAPFYNNIVWGNMVNGVVQADQINFHSDYKAERAARVFKNNAVTLTENVGVNTILLPAEVDPGFADIANADFRLVWTSPILDKGDNSLVTVEQDLVGAARIQGLAVDPGCYELPYYTLTVAAFENATLTVNGMPMVAGEYPLPQGFTAAASILAADGYAVKNVMVGETEIVAVEGVYTLPALMANTVVTINVEKKDATAIDQTQTEVQSTKVLRNGQLFILRGEKMYDTIGRLVK